VDFFLDHFGMGPDFSVELALWGAGTQRDIAADIFLAGKAGQVMEELMQQVHLAKDD